MIERARAREIENEEKQEAKMSLTCERRKKETHGRKTWMGGAEGKGARKGHVQHDDEGRDSRARTPPLLLPV